LQDLHVSPPVEVKNACAVQKNTHKPRDGPVNEKAVKRKITDEEFLQVLRLRYTWLDFDREMAKMDAWLLAHPGRMKTRRFIVNWLNKIEKPIEGGVYDPNREPTDEIERRIWKAKKLTEQNRPGHPKAKEDSAIPP